MSAIWYHVFGNSGSGGPVDYTTPLATVTGAGPVAASVGGSPVTFGLGSDAPVTGGLGAGDPPVYVASGLSVSFALAVPADWWFAVRAFYAGTDLEEHNLDARVRVHLSAAGADLAGLPNVPAGLTLSPLAGGGLRARWSYPAAGQGGPPAGFHAYFGAGAPDFSAPAATVPYSGASFYSADFPALAPGHTYLATVRAYNATGESADDGPASFDVPASAPLAPVPVSAVAVP